MFQQLDLSGIQTRDDMFAMKQRMEQRGHALDAARVASHAPPPAPEPAPVPQGSVQSVNRCRSLRDRVHDRMTRPSALNPNHTLPPPLLYEGTKDLYTHEAPFPVRTVYEVQQIRNPTAVPIETLGGARPDTLLLAAESAALVQTLEDRLGQALKRIATLEDELELERTQNATHATRLMIGEKEILSLQSRNDELVRQAELIRKECQTSLDELRIKCSETLTVAMAGERAAGATAVGEVEKVTHTLDSRIKVLSTDKFRLEELVAELRTQLTQNAQSLQISTQTVRQLTAELLQAKQQSTFVSSGYRKLEADLKAANALIVAKDAELTVTRGAAKNLEKLTDEHAKANRDLKLAQETNLALKNADTENKKLKADLAKLEKDTAEKDIRLDELKSHVDQVRSQAHAAYRHAKGFQHHDPMSGGAGVGGALMYTGGGGGDPSCPVHGGGGAASGLNASFDALRREVELEGQRAKEEQRKWKTRLELSPSRVR